MLTVSNTNMYYIGIVIMLVLLFSNYMPNSMKQSQVKVFGKLSCSWTKKQLDYLKQNNIPHLFIDCSDTPHLCKNIDSYPVTIDNDGKRHIGFTEL